MARRPSSNPFDDDDNFAPPAPAAAASFAAASWGAPPVPSGSGGHGGYALPRSPPKSPGVRGDGGYELSDGEELPMGEAHGLVLAMIRDAAQTPPRAYPFESVAQYALLMTMPVGPCTRFTFVFHAATKTFHLQHKGSVLLIARKRTDGFKMLSTAWNFNVCFPAAPDDVPFKFRSNTQGSEMFLYDDGANPYKQEGPTSPKRPPRKELCAILMNDVEDQSRSITFILPREGKVCQPTVERDGLLALDARSKARRFESCRMEDRSTFPSFIDFAGLAQINSIKNFWLHGADKGVLCLVSGKTGKHTAEVLAQGDDMSPVLIFAACLASWTSLYRPKLGRLADKLFT